MELVLLIGIVCLFVWLIFRAIGNAVSGTAKGIGGTIVALKAMSKRDAVEQIEKLEYAIGKETDPRKREIYVQLLEKRKAEYLENYGPYDVDGQRVPAKSKSVGMVDESMWDEV